MTRKPLAYCLFINILPISCICVDVVVKRTFALLIRHIFIFNSYLWLSVTKNTFLCIICIVPISMLYLFIRYNVLSFYTENKHVVSTIFITIQ